ncbi:ZinT family metal-binding protein [Alkalicoccobacillus porphyridii]|uniref:ZinT family metal-binding protein n=1 Tax=Alkalicoccobacillus porphyridii TaxID=2597270 RepID=A0A553ZX39_9BACI|nr:ZinT/AdcA family metal-binding protein [Alkalicoccobacillus porphyridii]TSB45955.1 ZinT family metal-binding protein [Alkalicoccobacillus porphyridii]
MGNLFGKSIFAIAIIVMLGACQSGDQASTESHDNEESVNHEVKEEVVVEGLADHYHTGDSITLKAVLKEEVDSADWHWYIRDDEHSEWEIVADQEGKDYLGTAEVDGQQVKAVLFDGQHEAYVQSKPVEITIDDHEHSHNHAHDEESEKIYAGYFEDDQIEDRTIADWQGDWQSVYPYLESGELDEVFSHKAKENADMTEEEYKEYYEVGYETDVDRIVIEGETFTFYTDSEQYSADYVYDGYEVLRYEKGNRGVRFIFALNEEVEEMPEYIQFSDHSIFPTEAFHFHLYWGDDRAELLEEVTNWPTYYPTDMDADEIVHEMIAH